MKKCLGAAIAALALMAGTAAPANADPIRVPGCYGVGFVVCNPGVTTGIDLGSYPVPVCTGTCTTIWVPVPADDPYEGLCIVGTSPSGQTTYTCFA